MSNEAPTFNLSPEEIAAIEASSSTDKPDLETRVVLAAEQVVLGTLIATNGSSPLPVCLAQLLNNAPDSFCDNRHKQISSVIQGLKYSGAAIYPQAVIERCEFDDAATYVATLVAGALSVDLASREGERIWQAYRERRTGAVLSEAFEAVANNPSMARSVAANVRAVLVKLEDDSVKDGLPEIVDVASLAATSPVLPVQIVEGVLHIGSKFSLGGASKAFKSWTLINMGLSVSTGEPWLGFSTTRSRVLYINFEIQAPFMHKRIETLTLARMIFPEPGWFDMWNLRGKAAPYNVIIPKIIRRAREQGYGLIIIDPYYKMFATGQDENSATDVNAIMNGLESIACETGASVGYGTHFAKGNAADKEFLDRQSGSGVFAREPDTVINFTKHKQEDCFTVEMGPRNLAPIQKFVVKWHYPQFTREDSLNPEDLKTPKTGRPKQYDPDALVALLGDTPMTTSEWKKTAADELGVPRTTFFEMVSDLKTNNTVFKSPVTGRWTPRISLKSDKSE